LEKDLANIAIMVSTRSNPYGDFPSFDSSSPIKKTPRTSTASPAPMGKRDLIGLNASPPSFRSATRRVVSNVRDTAYTARDAAADTISVAAPPAPSEIGEAGWCHTTSNLTVLWLCISIPLVLWDSLYILLRPHTFEGGALQWPIWKPYELYASIDKVYSRSAWDANEGFGGAQGVLNAVELVMYGLYAMILYNHGVKAPSGTGLQAGQGVSEWFAGGVKVKGKVGNRALIIGFSAAVMTLSKTVLYCKCIRSPWAEISRS
jgi:hypothetical protein